MAYHPPTLDVETAFARIIAEHTELYDELMRTKEAAAKARDHLKTLSDTLIKFAKKEDDFEVRHALVVIANEIESERSTLGARDVRQYFRFGDLSPRPWERPR